MKTDAKLKTALVLGLGLLVCTALGHEVPVHEAITVNAAQSAYINSSGYHGFADVIASDFSYFGPKGATNSMRIGSREEDDTPKQDPHGSGGNRSYNHFYDPLDTIYGKGLTDVPNDRRSSSPVGNNSFVCGGSISPILRISLKTMKG